MYISVLNYPPKIKFATKFLLNRLIRIWPLYFIATFVQNPGKIFTLEMLQSMLFYPLRATKEVFSPPVLSLQGWTLNYEMYFYLIFGVALLSKHRLVIVSLWSFFALVVLPKLLTGHFIVSFYVVNYPLFMPVYLNLICMPFILYFLFGCILGKIYSIEHKELLDKSKIYVRYFIWLILVLSTILLLYTAYISFKLQVQVAQLGLLATVVILVTLLFAERFNLIASPNKILLLLGNMSYSIYVWHSLPLKFFPLGADFTLTKFVLSVITTLVISYFSYIFIEEKLTKFLKVKLLSYWR